MGRIDVRLKERGIERPTGPMPVANCYVGAVQTGNLLFRAGHTPLHEEPPVSGKLARGFTIEQGHAAARECGGAVQGRRRPPISSPARELLPR